MNNEKSEIVRRDSTLKIAALLAWALFNIPFQQSIYAHVQKNIDFDHLTREDGLSQNNVYAITQDYKGFMWFGAEDGLNMYDGYKFTIFKPDPDDPAGISDSFINCIYEDRSHNLWIATGSGGLNRFDRETLRFKRYNNQPGDVNSLSSDCVTTISGCSSNPDILWLGTSGGGLNKFDTKKETFTQYRSIPESPNSLSNDDIYHIFEDRSGALWVGTLGGGLNKFSCQKEQFVRFQNDPLDPHSLSNNDVFAIYEDRKGRLWIGTDKGLNRFDPAKNEFIGYFHDPADPGSLNQDRIRAIFEDHRGTLWVGTMGGGLNMLVQENDNNKFEFMHYQMSPSNPSGLNKDDIFCIYEDRFGVLWIGTEGGGINKLDLEKKPFYHYRANPLDPSSLSNNDIWAICQSRINPGFVWIGTKGGGLNKFDRQTETFFHYRYNPGNPNSIGSDSIYALCEDRAGDLWIGTDGEGLNRMDVEKGTFTRYIPNANDPDSLSGSDIWAIVEDRQGMLWVSTPYDGLNKLNRETGKFTHYHYNPDDPKSINSNNIWALYADRAGVLWVGTDSGINKFDREKEAFTLYNYQPDNPNSLSNGRILCIYEDHTGMLWVGTLGGGLNKFDRVNEKFTRYTEKEGLPNNAVYGILEEIPSPGSPDYYLWLSTSAGVLRFNPRTGESKAYNKDDGLQGNEFNAGAYYKNNEGEMFFGGTNGFNCFNPLDIKDNPYIPPVMITGLQVLNEEVKPGKKVNGRIILTRAISETPEITLSHNDNIVSLEFAALHYASPRANRYAYRLEGLENNWNYVEDRRFATYTRLTPGHYTFRVKAANNDGRWNETGAALEITVVTPIWQTGWFYALCILTILITGLGIHQVRVRSLKDQEKRLTLLVQERTQEVEKANRYKSDFLARMSHEIRTPMNSIIGFADLILETPLSGEQTDFIAAIKQSGDTLLGIINEILDLSRIEAGQLLLETIDFEVEAAAFNACELLIPRIGDRSIELLCHIDDGVPAIVRGDVRRFQQVLINLMGNAVKFTPSGEVELAIRVEDDDAQRVKLLTTVRDTGMGIPQEKYALIFEAFQQADISNTREFGGTGLGLSISKQIARLMGGDIQVESKPGIGSTFFFTAWLGKTGKTPADPGNAPLIKDDRTDAQVPVKENNEEAIHILLVEDNKLNRKLAEYLLIKAGYHVDIAVTGKEAVETFLSDPGGFDMILMDIQMPEMDGKDAARFIRDSGYTDIPIIAMTAASMKGDREKCVEAGMNDYISKPIKKDILYQLIKKWIT
ncbi:MAG: ATP-binding protein [Candidatus Aminicenantes bacterium]|nr:ATP-binding protein [Candidatus Aminicenantes bacterium]